MKILFAIILFFIPLSLISQQIDGKLEVSGRVHDAETHAVLQYVTITLQDLETKEIVGDITNKEGEFKLSVPKGRYYFISESLSFSPFIISILNIDQNIELGTIELSQNYEKLDEIEILAKNKLVDFSFAKKVYNASKDIANVGGNAITVLENTPSVRIDEQGNISVRGNSAIVLVNGKPYGGQQSNADILSLIPANSIQKVEIISRSAKYEAQGGGGILNIVLKSATAQGYNGTIEVHGGIPDNDGISTFLNYKTDKINIFSTASFNHIVRIKDSEIRQVFLNDRQVPFSNFDEERLDHRQRNSLLLNIGSDFYIDDKNTFTTSLLYSGSNKNYNSDLYLNDYQPIDQLNQSSFREVEDNTDDSFLEAYVYYTTKFKKEGHELSANINFDKNTAKNNTFIDNTISYPQPDTYNQKSIKNQYLNDYNFQIDYVLPLNNDAVFEAGHKSNFKNYENDFIVSNFNPSTRIYESIPQFANKINYDEKIFGFYANYMKNYEKLSFSIGLRSEISNTEISEDTDDQSYTNDYNDLFPSALISYTFENNSTISSNYTRYIDRPTVAQLNPFNSIADERFQLVGNPFLNPYYTNYFQLEYQREFEKISLNSALFYSNSTDIIMNVLEKTGSQTVDGFDIYRRIPINNGILNYLGLELELTYSPFKKLRLFGMLSPYFTDLSKTRDHLYDYNDLILYGRFVGLYKFTSTFRFQLNYEYQSPKRTAITELGTIQYANAILSKDLFEGKATLTFRVNDIFHSREAVYNSLEANTITDRTAIFDTQYLLSFTYRFNKASKRNTNNRTKDMDKNVFEIEEKFK